IGNTEGNLSRIHKDLVQMRRGQKISSGIMSLQKKYLTNLQEMAKDAGRPFADVLGRLQQITADDDEQRLRENLKTLPPDEWFLFKKVLRFPIPYFMCGLDAEAERFISQNALPPPRPIQATETLSRSPRIALDKIQVSSTYKI